VLHQLAIGEDGNAIGGGAREIHVVRRDEQSAPLASERHERLA
jgi:hypothetical protein